ncbi:MAG: hypothetical protein CI952_68 [Methanohalophilus sp.]|jgi:hypothetical protein|nr:MAG: hypothetical protein CI952_68 [Methanohalophilus sp.]
MYEKDFAKQVIRMAIDEYGLEIIKDTLDGEEAREVIEMTEDEVYYARVDALLDADDDEILYEVVQRDSINCYEDLQEALDDADISELEDEINKRGYHLKEE